MSIAEQLDTVVAGTWKSDPVHSRLGFEVKHMVVSTFRGGFADFDAVLDADGLRGRARVESIDSVDDTQRAHLMSPDFFDIERHPELRFASSTIARVGEEFRVDGELTIKGVTRPVWLRGAISGPIEDPYGGHRLGIDLEATVDRRDFGLAWNAPLPGGGIALNNDVKLVAHFEFVEEA